MRADARRSIDRGALRWRPVVAALFLVAWSLPLHAQQNSSGPESWGGTDRGGWVDEHDILSIGLGGVLSPGGGNFFEGYRTLGGSESSIEPYWMPTVTGRLRVGRDLRAMVTIGYGGTGFLDVHDIREASPEGDPRPGAFVAAVDDELSATVVPVLAGVEFTPIRSQFTTYVGGALGLAVVGLEWSTTTRQAEGGFYRPAVNTKGMSIAPSARIFTGVDFRFDRFFGSRTSFRGIFLEAGYVVLPVTRDYFAELRRQGRGVPLRPNEDRATLELGGFTFTVGLNLQVLRK
jgi:hypothetical protein